MAAAVARFCWSASDALARAQLLLELVGCGQAIGERARLVGEGLLEAGDFLAPVARLAARPRAISVVRFLARLELRFLAEGFGVALGLLLELPGLRFGARQVSSASCRRLPIHQRWRRRQRGHDECARE